MTIDVVDATSPADAHEVATIKAAGGDPIVMVGMCGAVADAVGQIIRKAKRPRQITLLRFHGHGAPGMMNIAAGTEPQFEHQSGVATSNLSDVRASLGKLKPYFAPTGRVELHGCNVAQGKAGEELIRGLAILWEVPVSAGVDKQYGGRSHQFVFEGPIRTAQPDGSLGSGLP
jgi:hypothetical protein